MFPYFYSYRQFSSFDRLSRGSQIVPQIVPRKTHTHLCVVSQLLKGTIDPWPSDINGTVWGCKCILHLSYLSKHLNKIDVAS